MKMTTLCVMLERGILFNSRFGNDHIWYNGPKTFVRHIKKIKLNKVWPTTKLPFNYTAPEKINHLFNSGDLDQTIGKIDYSQPKINFELSEELRDADENVKRLFSLELASRKEVVEFKKRELISSVQQHKFDTESIECKIAERTLTVRRLQEHMLIQKFDKVNKKRLNELIGKRNKLLKELHSKDLERFNWIVKKLQIDYKRPLLGVVTRNPTRMDTLIRMTNEYCANIRNTRLDSLHEKLKAQQEDFLKEKEEMTKFIEKEESELDVKIS